MATDIHNYTTTVSGGNWETLLGQTATEYKIKGVSLIADYSVVSYCIPISHSEQSWKDHVKRELALKLATIIMEKHAEFTKMETPDGLTTYKARCFLVYSEDVQMLRTNNLIR